MKKITQLKDNQIFVFGSNANGDHAGGAALQALKYFGAITGQAKGLQGQSYAITTLNEVMVKVDLSEIAEQLDILNEFAKTNSDKEFLVTLIGCGIAGFSIKDIKPLFTNIKWSNNVIIPMEFQSLIFYKGFDEKLQCRGEQFVVGNTYLKNNLQPLRLCSDLGYHFCTSLSHVHDYYDCSNKSSNRFCIVEPIGEIEFDDTKCIARGIKIVRELTLSEIDSFRYSGTNNTGMFNSGDRNSGYRNSGDRNSGDLNSGYRNSGYRNSGDLNSGYLNSGDLNSGYRNSGVFCTRKEGDTITIFNQSSNMTWSDWRNHLAFKASLKLELTTWVDWECMSEKEKTEHPKAYIQNGYLKVFEYKDAWANLWSSLTDIQKNSFKTLPNFDSNIFREITGIDF